MAKRTYRRSLFPPWWTVPLILTWIVLGKPATPSAQEALKPSGSPYLLVATVGMPDPMFEHSVVLMLSSSREAPIIAGVIINKPTDVTWGNLFKGSAELKQSREKVYFGGPVAFTEPILMMRTPRPAKGTAHVINDLYADANLKEIVGFLKNSNQPQSLRLFLGRAQWTPNQLQNEIHEGAWQVMPAKVDAVFSSNPAELWQELAHPAHLREVSTQAEPRVATTYPDSPDLGWETSRPPTD